MQTELLIANKAGGEIFEVSKSAESCQWTTNRTGQPGKFTFSVLKSPDLKMAEGDVVRFSVDGQLQFYGWIFTRSEDRWGQVSVTCYDRLRYLKANASYAFYAMTAGDIIRQIAGDLQLDVGAIADTGFAIPSLIKENQTCLDIIQAAIEQTLLSTGKVYVLYDDGTGLALQEPANMMSDTLLGDKSLVTDYTYSSDIDKQTYNSIKLVKPNEETGQADVYIQQDSDTIGQWGLLQYYEKVDSDLNEAQIKAQAAASLEYYNRVLRSVKLSSLGILGLRAGMMAYVKLENAGDAGVAQWVLLEKVSHKWENNLHTMDVEAFSLT